MPVSLDTRLTELLGCKYPIVQTAMGWVADPNLVAGTCNAGGFGFLAASDIVVSHPEAKIGYPPPRLGLSPALMAPFR